jgi:hypothetical protein
MPFSRLLRDSPISSEKSTTHHAADFTDEGVTIMYRNLKFTLALIFIATVPLHLKATAQAASGEVLNAKQLRELEKSAVTAADHERLAAYYQSQAEQAQKKLADAEELEKKWGPAERASKVPDPYPHARRLVAEYSAQAQKYSRLAEDHQWMAEKYEIAARAMKDSGSTIDNSASESNPKQGSGSGRNAFTLGPKK